jgi:hypothetical protein
MEEELLQKGRIIAATMLTGGIVLVGVDLMMLVASRGFILRALVLAPMCLLLGIGGLFDPRVCLLGNHAQGRTFPRWTRVVGTTLVVVGLAVGGYLAFVSF